MARRSRFSPMNFLYSLLGLAAVGAAAYYVWRQARLARVEGAEGSEGGSTMMELRRAGRKAGRNAKDATEQVGKEIKRGAQDVSEAFEDITPTAKPF